MTAVCTAEGVFTFGVGVYGRLGHGGEEDEIVPRLVEALAGKKVIGAAAGESHTAVWTEVGGLFTFGDGMSSGLLPGWASGPEGIQRSLCRGRSLLSRKHEATRGAHCVAACVHWQLQY